MDNEIKLVWLDLETTGLDPTRHDILSVGIEVTDAALNPVSPKFEAVCRLPQYPENGWEWEREALAMHIKNGLLSKTLEAPKPVGPHAGMGVRADAAQFLNAFTKDPKKTYITGSSVHFDVAFLKVHAPELLRFMHYRVLDVSVLKVLGTMWGFEAPSGEKAHTPLADLDFSRKELRHWISTLFNLTVVPAGVL